ncbi:MAG: energy transducer TonB [Opitutaceae bacterium]
MDSLERQLKNCSRSWGAFLGAPAFTVLIFLLIASTSAVMQRPKDLSEPALALNYVPPTPAPLERITPTPLSAKFADILHFDPGMATPVPDIPLDLLDIRLKPSLDPGLAKEVDMQRTYQEAAGSWEQRGNDLGMPFDMHNTFEVQKPLDLDRVIIFERNQVDEIPVWLYGPMPRVPSRLDRKDADALVLYVVSDKGRTSNIYVLDASDSGLIEPVKDAIADWRFRPARKNGKSVRVWVQHPINFRPESKSPFTI